ncbi:MAG: DUF1501 domain-containing protein [Pseudomonadota bacterium]
MLDRRRVLQLACASALAAGAPRLSLARADTDARLVLVILRGAMDGLAFAPPYGEPAYAGLRGELALPGPSDSDGALKLDGLFGLHPSLAGLAELYRDGELILAHAVASPYRRRSHFDAQDILENGVSVAGQRRDGWLNRAVGPLNAHLDGDAAIALAMNAPLVLRGEHSVSTWAPSKFPEAGDDTLRRIEQLYVNDAFFRTRLERALESQQLASELDPMDSRRRRGNDGALFMASMRQAAHFLSADSGPRIAVVESGGWDTHANQGAVDGLLARKFSALDEGVLQLRRGLGGAWKRTVCMIVTEFGRTVKVNGTRGTDHGTGTVTVLAGGAVAGGRIIADWPGLAARNLFEGRDLYPSTDIRSLFKGVLAEHLDLPETLLEREVFPDSSRATLMAGLIA